MHYKVLLTNIQEFVVSVVLNILLKLNVGFVAAPSPVPHGLPVYGEVWRGGEGGDGQGVTPEHGPQPGQLPVLQHRVKTVLQLVILHKESVDIYN